VPSVPTDARQPAAFYLACGYLPAGPRAVRLDRMERAAAVASRLSRGGPFVPPRDLAPILGCPPDDVPAVLTAIGYVEKDGRFERRPRRLTSRFET
jgi:ATP-dependent RNA helicase SUPV3L1/SUV3